MKKAFLTAVSLVLLTALCLPGFAAQAPLIIDSEYLDLFFVLPEGWFQIDDPDRTVFSAPDSVAVLIIDTNGPKVDRAFFDDFSQEYTQAWVRRENEPAEIDEIEQYMFTKVFDQGKLYALSDCGYMLGKAEIAFLHYVITATDGTLASVSFFFRWEDDSAALANWFTGYVFANMPEEVREKLLAGGE